MQKPEPMGEQQVFTLSQLRDFRQQAELLAAQLEELGPVDPESLAEFEAVNERYLFVSKQYEDLLQARDSLNQLLQQTEEMMAEQFSDFLLLAQQSFSQPSRIYSGRRGQLKNRIRQRWLGSRIDIEVKLPGKKNQALNLLSGGERALTCIAFIFAL